MVTLFKPIIYKKNFINRIFGAHVTVVTSNSNIVTINQSNALHFVKKQLSYK